MKNKYRNTMLHSSLAALAFATGSAFAGTEVVAPAAPAPPTDWLKVSGYAALAYTYTDFDGAPNNETFADGGTPLDAVRVGFEATQGPFVGYASLFYTPDSFSGGHEAGILDAYLSYKTGNLTITGGKYLSWLGYEAFHAPNMNQISYANRGVGAIPAYHSGLKAEYKTEVFGTGINVSDSIRGGTDSFWSGDEEFSDSIGYEAYFVYKGFDKLTLWSGIAYEDASNGFDEFITYDFWASYQLSDKITIAGELAYNDKGTSNGVQGIAFLKYAFTEAFSTVFRLGFDEVSGLGADQMKFTVSPTYVFNEHLLARAEVSYIDSDADDAIFSGVQAILKF